MNSFWSVICGVLLVTFATLSVAGAAEPNSPDPQPQPRAATTSRPTAADRRNRQLAQALYPYLDQRYMTLSGGVLSGTLAVNAEPVLQSDVATKGYVDNAISAAVSGFDLTGKVNRTGDTMTGMLTLSGDPSGPLDAATKQYVDSKMQVNAPAAAALSGWGLNGNAGTTSVNFVGTTDNQALELKVNNQRALRLEPAQPNNSGPIDGAPNLIGGSAFNSVDPSAISCTIAGGGFSLNPQAIHAAEGGAIGGGEGNTVSGNYGTVSGGFMNVAAASAWLGGGFTNTAGAFAALGGGRNNTAGSFAFVGGGQNNAASGDSAVVPGGQGNTAAGPSSFAAGNRARAMNPGEFVWADGVSQDFPNASEPLFTPASNDYLVRATGGIVFVTGVNAGAASAGVKVAAGSGSWTTLSDRNTKANFRDVDVKAVLNKVAGLPMQTWNYKTQPSDVRHIGPMSQDFHAAFGVGEDEHGISVVDAEGVSLASIQALHQLLAEKQQEIDALKAQNDAIISRLEKLEQRASGAADHVK